MKRRIPFAAMMLPIALGAAAALLSCKASHEDEAPPAAQGEAQAQGVVALDQSAAARGGIVARRLGQETVPETAVVWLDGKAWIYAEDTPQHFSRHEIVATGSTKENEEYRLGAGERGKPVVVVGAQLLLSEEFRFQIEAGEGP